MLTDRLDEAHASLLRQQTVRAKFGELALRSNDLDEILTEACRLIGEALGTELAKVMELKSDGETLLVRAGVGWKPGVVGVVTLKVEDFTSEGLALQTGEPMISPNIATETRFKYPQFLSDNGVQAVANVIIIGSRDQPPFGILQIDSRTPREFTDDDIGFLKGYANLIAAAVDRLRTIDDTNARQARLEVALAAGELGSWEIDLVTSLVMGSRRTLEIFGHVGAPPIWDADAYLQCVLPEDRQQVIETFREAAKSRKIWHVECRIRRADDAEIRWVEGQGRLIGQHGDASATRLIGIVADITSRKLAEETHRHAQKMEVIGQLTGGIAHDFNNLLTVVSISLESLEMEYASSNSAALNKYIATAQAASNRAAKLTHRLLAFARRQPLRPVTVNAHKLVVEMGDLIRQTVGPEIKVEIVTAVNLWSTSVDPNQLENALLNLCINARDAMPHGGKLVVETGNVTLDQPSARKPHTLHGEYVSLCVTDTGTGMSADVMIHAFEPFYTTKPVGAGTGLGLSMIYGFANQSGGQVRLESRQEIGTSVMVYLPRHKTKPSETGFQIEASQASKAGTGESILIVDDLPEVRMLAAEALTRLGYSMTEASDGASALSILQSGASFDLLITDVGMPGGMNGRQLADAARLLHPKLPILFMTGYTEALLSKPELDTDMFVLTKPFSLSALATKVKLSLDVMKQPSAKTSPPH